MNLCFLFMLSYFQHQAKDLANALTKEVKGKRDMSHSAYIGGEFEDDVESISS